MQNVSDTTGSVNSIRISTSPITDFSRRDFKTFYSKRLANDQLMEAICSSVWSPISYRNNQRRKTNFDFAELIALDFDEGMTCAEAKALLVEWQCWGIVGTTKSHQKPKKTDSGEIRPPCDRFRFILRMSPGTNDCELYEYNVKRWISGFTADRGVKDGARFFYPCREIFYFQDGDPIDRLEFPKNYIRQKERQKYMRERDNEKLSSKGLLPRWVIRDVTLGVPVGDRHNRAYAIGAKLTELGYGFSEIVDYILSGPISAIGVADVEWCVGNAREKIIGKRA